MPCYSPLEAWRSRTKGRNGKYGVTFDRRDANRIKAEELRLPCGQCVGCRLDRSKMWAVRIMHEASLHEKNCFITLTYDEDHLPDDHGLCKKHFQAFMKRLRKKLSPKKVRFYMCGEYGEKLGRPHYHAIIFGYDFPDRYLWKERDGNRYYVSEALSRLWPFGYHDISEVNIKSAAYVARYVMKKQTGEKAEKHYEKVDAETGEIYRIEPEYNSMSRYPAIAEGWYEKYKKDCDKDFIVCEGKKVKIPRYYDKLLEKENSELMEEKKKARIARAKAHVKDQSYERLEVRKKCAESRSAMLKRSLK